jgi:hypothetical protein
VHHDLRLGEEATAPHGKRRCRLAELVKKDVARFNVRRWRVPSKVDHIHKTGDPHPKVFKLERPRLGRPSIIGKQKGAMV